MIRGRHEYPDEEVTAAKRFFSGADESSRDARVSRRV
jgi:hypothetical protein